MVQEKPDSFLLGEVWEDGSNKIAYDQRRKYLLGREAHGLMNYPFRTAALAYLQGGGAEAFIEAMEVIRENYPRPAFYSAMNLPVGPVQKGVPGIIGALPALEGPGPGIGPLGVEVLPEVPGGGDHLLLPHL